MVKRHRDSVLYSSFIPLYLYATTPLFKGDLFQSKIVHLLSKNIMGKPDPVVSNSR
jgi:hypothetical protein